MTSSWIMINVPEIFTNSKEQRNQHMDIILYAVMISGFI